MAHVFVEASVSARRTATVRFLVDTGATYTIVPPALIRKVGAPVLGRRFRVSPADGRARRLQACLLGIRIGRRAGATTALVLPGAEPLLGVETLEVLGLRVDPVRRRIEPTRAQTALLVGARGPGATRLRDPLRR
jgi:clan AA aspartic protease